MYVKKKKEKIVEKCLLRPRVKNLLLHFFASFVERKIHRNVKKKSNTKKKRKKIAAHKKYKKNVIYVSYVAPMRFESWLIAYEKQD